MEVKLTQLVEALEAHDLLIRAQNNDLTIKSLAFHSQKCGEQCLFIVKGRNFKREYLTSLHQNVVAYVSEKDYDVDLPLILVKDSLKAMAVLADCFYGHPSHDLNMIGITGTKGKTSSLYFLKSILEAYTYPGDLAYMGTVEIYNGHEVVPSLLTTPESLTLHEIFHDVKEYGKKNVVMEVSSQALKYDRVYGIDYNYGIFLNISNDHISDVEHPTFEDYLQSKLKIFDHSKVGIINEELVHYLPDHLKDRVQTFSISKPATIQAVDIELSPDGSKFNVFYQNKKYPMHLAVPGLFNVENALSVILVAIDMGIPFEVIDQGLSKAFVPGRMLQIKHPTLPIVSIIDYAHNDASFTKIFEYAKTFYGDYHIKAIFGCPGDKAFNRRHELGLVANQFADEIYLVPDDPGHEPVSQINKQIQEVITKPCFHFEDRVQGIHQAFDDIKEPTVLMILGKGIEATQKVNGGVVPYENDQVVCEQCMQEKVIINH